MTAPTAPVDRARPAQAAYLEYVASLPKRRLRSIDLEYRGKRYRLADPVREAGASVRLAGDHRACLLCPRRFRPESRCAVLPDGSGPLCIPCAIRVEALVRLPGDLVADAVDAAREAGIAWA